MIDRSKHMAWDIGDVEHHDIRTLDQIKTEFLKREIEYIDATEALTNECGMAPKDAESLVESWETECG